MAGEYPVMVLINPPDVIPGTATLDVFTHTSGISTIWAKPAYWHAGDEGTPQSDEMLPVPGEPGHYRGLIWLMNAGTSGIEIEVKHKTGNPGKVLVPVMAVSTVQRKMDPSLGWMLAGLCMFLVILMITIIGASVSDGLVKPDAGDTKNISKRRWKGALISGVILALILWGGMNWWNTWAQDYTRFMYKPFNATTEAVRVGNKNTLTFSIDTARLTNLALTRNISYIVPDHGKLMHMFLVRAGAMDVFAHLHPKRKDSVTFVTTIPVLPEGKYFVFADISRLSGFSETIPDTFEIQKQNTQASFASLDSTTQNPDDTYFFTNPITATASTQAVTDVIICGKPGIRTPLADGSTITWEHTPTEKLVANNLYSLKFSVLDETGKPALLEPYLGMAGHAVVMKDDGSVYIHLHPVGSYSMASQQTILKRFEDESGPVDFDHLPKKAAFRDSVDRLVTVLDAMPVAERDKLLMGTMNHAQFDPEHPDHALVSFPYAFPSAGKYRIWIQMKRNGKILNSAFDATVE